MRDYKSPEHMRLDLRDALEVQRAMLPATLPNVPGYSFWASWEPDLPLGGDLYYFHTLPTGHVLALVGDVSGKGIPAALAMASVSGLIPFVLENSGPDLTHFMSTLNREVYKWSARSNKFVTMIAVLLDFANHRLSVADAAHGLGLIRRDNGAIQRFYGELPSSGPLGLLEELQVHVSSLDLFPGDAVLLLTDGITGPTDGTNMAYVISRLARVVATISGDAETLGKSVLADVEAFTGELPARDDATLLCFAREKDKSR
jgi:sigma-B regulation protein RsbU (phosphoserine phosphatase)